MAAIERMSVAVRLIEDRPGEAVEAATVAAAHLLDDGSNLMEISNKHRSGPERLGALAISHLANATMANVRCAPADARESVSMALRYIDDFTVVVCGSHLRPLLHVLRKGCENGTARELCVLRGTG